MQCLVVSNTVATTAHANSARIDVVKPVHPNMIQLARKEEEDDWVEVQPCSMLSPASILGRATQVLLLYAPAIRTGVVQPASAVC